MSPYSEQYIVSHSLSINLKPWKKNHSFVFSFCLFKVLTFQILSFQILTWIFKIIETQNPEMHGHLWNADVYNPNRLVHYVHVCWLLPAFIFTFAFCKTVTVAFEQCGSLLLRHDCIVWGAFTPSLFEVIQMKSWTTCDRVCLSGKENAIQTLMSNK